MSYSIKVLTVFVLSLMTLASCTKDPVPAPALQSQGLSIDMSQYGDVALLALDEAGRFEVLGVQEGRARAEDIRFVLVPQTDAAGASHWEFASPDDKELDGLLADYPVRPSLTLRTLPAAEYSAANPKSQAELNDLFARAKAATPDGKRSGPLSPDTVILAKKDGDDTTYVIYIKICVEGSDWKVCVEVSW